MTATLLSYLNLYTYAIIGIGYLSWTAYAESLFVDWKPFREVFPHEVSAYCDCLDLSIFGKLVILLANFFLHIPVIPWIEQAPAFAVT